MGLTLIKPVTRGVVNINSKIQKTSGAINTEARQQDNRRGLSETSKRGRMETKFLPWSLLPPKPNQRLRVVPQFPGGTARLLSCMIKRLSFHSFSVHIFQFYSSTHDRYPRIAQPTPQSVTSTKYVSSRSNVGSR